MEWFAWASDARKSSIVVVVVVVLALVRRLHLWLPLIRLGNCARLAQIAGRERRALCRTGHCFAAASAGSGLRSNEQRQKAGGARCIESNRAEQSRAEQNRIGSDWIGSKQRIGSVLARLRVGFASGMLWRCALCLC